METTHSGMLPDPSISFTIPSIHHDTTLGCRIYHPKQSKTSASCCPNTKAVTIAHPYTPMGGCFDDHVLHAAGLEFLHQGYILGLFNLRGAGSSQGHTSWSSKPEQDDYCSFVGFLSCYMDELQHGCVQQSRLQKLEFEDSVEATRLPTSQDTGSTDYSIHQENYTQQVLVLGGYSYGSFIVRQLPDIDTILGLFIDPAPGTAAAEIKLRAAHLAQEYLHKQQKCNSKSRTLTVNPCIDSPVYGGDEGQPGTRKTHHESRRSFDMVRKSIEKTRAQFLRQYRGTKDYKQGESTPNSECVKVPEIRYLLISPLLPPISVFLALSSNWWKPDPAAEERLKNHQSLAVWGATDFFTSSKKLRKWASTLNDAPGSRFDFVESPNDGHFWLEAGAETRLRHGIRSWIQKLDAN